MREDGTSVTPVEGECGGTTEGLEAEPQLMINPMLNRICGKQEELICINLISNLWAFAYFVGSNPFLDFTGLILQKIKNMVIGYRRLNLHAPEIFQACMKNSGDLGLVIYYAFPI